MAKRGRPKKTEVVSGRPTVISKELQQETHSENVISKTIPYMVTELPGIQGWIYRTNGLFVVERTQEDNFRKFLINGGYIPAKQNITSAINFIDAIVKNIC